MSKQGDAASLSPIHSMYHPELRIDNSLELTARYFQGAAKFVDFIIRQNNKCKFAAICPFQFDFCIAVGKPLQILNSNHNEDSDDEDDFCYMDSIDHKPKYIDCIGDIEAKLKENNLRYASRNLEPSLGGYEMSRRDFVDLLNLMKEKYALTNPFDVDGNYVYPHKKRFIVMVDRRDVNDDEYETIYIWEAPEHCRDIPNQDASKWCADATNDCILPGYNHKDNIGASSRCHGSLLTLSFNVLQEDEIKCYLGWNGKLCHVEPADLEQVLPGIFNMEHTWRGEKNKRFINKKEANHNIMHGNYIFENNFKLANMAEDINKIIHSRDKEIDVNYELIHDQNAHALDEHIVDGIECIVQDILCGANPSQPDINYLHQSFVNESGDNLPKLPDAENYAITCPQQGSNQSNASPNNNQYDQHNDSAQQHHYSRNNGNENGFNSGNGNGDGDDEKNNNFNTNNILVQPCPGCKTLLKELKDRDAIIAQKNCMILQYQQLVNKLQAQVQVQPPIVYPFSMPTSPLQFINHDINNYPKYNNVNPNTTITTIKNTLSYPAPFALKKAQSGDSDLVSQKPAMPKALNLSDIRSRSLSSILSSPNSPQPDYPLPSVSNASTSTLASVSTDSYSSLIKGHSQSPKHKKRQKLGPRYTGYEPSPAINNIRLKRNVYIDHKITEKILSSTNAKCHDKKQLYSWMDMNVIPQFDRKENTVNEGVKILNFDFGDEKSQEPLFCVISADPDKADEKGEVQSRKKRWP